MVAEFLWRCLAWFVSRERVADYLIRRSMRTPYTHIVGEDGDVYMQRWWLFNPYPPSTADGGGARYPWCPISVRVHHIRRPDRDRHLHDHPWDFRTVVLLGGYEEVREDCRLHARKTGDTASLRFGEFHRIASVSDRVGAVTLFITWRRRGTWGFLVDGQKVPYRQYLGAKK